MKVVRQYITKCCKCDFFKRVDVYHIGGQFSYSDVTFECELQDNKKIKVDVYNKIPKWCMLLEKI